jgi:hypothetical protein
VCGDNDARYTKKGSVPGVISVPTLLRRPSPWVAQRRRGLQSFGTPFQKVPLDAEAEAEVDSQRVRCWR